MSECLPRLRQYARCKQGSIEQAQTWRKHVCHTWQAISDGHCLVVPEESGSQLLGRGCTKPWVLEKFASEGVLDRTDKGVWKPTTEVIAHKLTRCAVGVDCRSTYVAMVLLLSPPEGVMAFPTISAVSELDGDPVDHYASAHAFSHGTEDTCRSSNRSSKHLQTVTQRLCFVLAMVAKSSTTHHWALLAV
jgi:hypothetical protein